MGKKKGTNSKGKGKAKEEEETTTVEGGEVQEETTAEGAQDAEEEKDATTTTEEGDSSKPMTRKEKKKAGISTVPKWKKDLIVKQNKKGDEATKPKSLTSIPLVERVDEVRYRLKQGFVPNMRVEAQFYARDSIAEGIFSEYTEGGGGGMLPALKQLANVASIPGIIGASLGMPDIHSGYGFAIGNVAAIDMDDPNGIVAPGGVGFDINCGVRLLRSNLTEEEVQAVKEKIATALYKQIPLGLGSEALLSIPISELDKVLDKGMEYLAEQGYVWPEDITKCEAGGCLKEAKSELVSNRAKLRGVSQVGSLGSGNHYLEVQVIDEVYDEKAAEVMGLKKGNVCVMIHSGSRGLGHQVCTDYLQTMSSSRDRVLSNDKQLTGVKINSSDGQKYIAAMSAAANFAFCNRSMMMHQTRQVFEEVFNKSAKKLDMHMVYDVAHNIAKIEDHVVNGEKKKVLVHRKGATRAFGPGHPEIPKEYQEIGQPVLIGGSMGTASYVLTGTQKAMDETFGSTCHGAGRVMSRSAATRELSSAEVMRDLTKKGITLKAASKKGIAEEAPESYKDVSEVVQTCHDAGISKLCVKLRPICVVKG